MILIIAEAGVNHNGDVNVAIELINAAHSSGANIVKFQTFKAKSLVTQKATKAEYQKDSNRANENQLAMLERLELPYKDHFLLIDHCNTLGIEFLSTAFDSESLDFLVNELGLKRLKLPSGDLTNAPLVLEHARTGCELIVSTGMSSLGEVEMALGVIAFGFTSPLDAKPSIEAFREAYASEVGQEALRNKVKLLHCTTEYPAPFSEINLNAMKTLRSSFNLPVGYSDHSEGITIPVAATAIGAEVIEKHFTLDKNMEGPDHKASLEPKELSDMVRAIRNIEMSLGTGVKVPSESELKNIIIARKGLVAAKDIKCGESFNTDNIAIKRPSLGRTPYDYWDILNTYSSKNYKAGDPIIE